jgi:hypothetical protein
MLWGESGTQKGRQPAVVGRKEAQKLVARWDGHDPCAYRRHGPVDSEMIFLRFFVAMITSK